jgi:ABC-type branched-subunit amino acid transport system substrate-binding protein
MQSIKGLVVGAGMIAAVAAQSAAAADAPSAFKISAIIGLSGPLAVIGADMRRGVETALEERGNKIGGIPIEITWDDSEGKPQVTVQKASQRIAQGTNMIFGEIGSPSTIALANLTEQRETPLLVTFAADNALTTPGRLKWTFRTGKNVTSTVTVTTGFAEENKVKKVFGITPDYDAARDSWNLFKDLAKARGIEIVGEEFHPTPNRDFSILIDKAIRSGADALYAVSQGNDAVTLVKQANEVGLKEKMKLFGPGIVDEVIMRAVGPAGVGVGSTIRYHWSEDFPANRDFVERYRKKFGEYPSANAGDAYDGMRWWLRVVEGTHSWDKKDWIAAMANSSIEDSIEGRKVMGACDHQARQIALAGVGIENTAPDLPKYGMRVTYVMQPDQIYKPCP